MAVAWVVFPLVLLAVCLGCGLAAERVGGWLVPGGLLPSLGLALVIVVATLTTQHSSTARATTWLVLAIAIAGYATSIARLRAFRLAPWAVAVGVGVFLVCAAPVVLTGNATFLGYFIDNDSAFHFSLIDHLLVHGRALGGIPNSAYYQILHQYIGTSYPTGTDVALGAVRPLVGQDVAWIFQPYLAVILGLGGTALYELLRFAVRSHPMRALSAFIAGQAGLVYSFYLEDSIKELATTWVITLTVALVFATLRRLSLRGLFPLVIAAVAGLDVLDLAVAPWLALPLAAFAVAALWQTRHTLARLARRRVAAALAGGAAVVAVLAEPILSQASTFLHTANGVLGQGSSNVQAQLGNLAAPLQHWQLFGIWPTGDFRNALSTHYRVGYALIGIALASALLGTVWMIRRRALAPLLMLAGTGIAAVFLLGRSSPYAASKVMMIFSLTVVLTSMLGATSLLEAGRRIEGWVLAAVIAGGVLWTNALSYSNASIAPRDRMADLAAIGERFVGTAPALYNQSDEFAIHFLRNEEVVDPATGPIAPRPGLPPRTAGQDRLPWDPDDVDPTSLQTFRLLVLGRSPRISRPPADFKLVYEDRYYDVWKRMSGPRVLAHVPLGGGLYPVSVPGCRLVTSTAAQAKREHARLAYATGSNPPAFVPTKASYPPNWGLVEGDPYELIPRQQPGDVTGRIRVTAPGSYQVWLESTLSQRFTIWIGGRRVGFVQDELGPQGQFVPVGQVTLPAGSLPVKIERPPVGITPGDDATGMLLGPLFLLRSGRPEGVSEIDPTQAHALCGRPLDWLEIVR